MLYIYQLHYIQIHKLLFIALIAAFVLSFALTMHSLYTLKKPDISKLEKISSKIFAFVFATILLTVSITLAKVTFLNPTRIQLSKEDYILQISRDEKYLTLKPVEDTQFEMRIKSGSGYSEPMKYLQIVSISSDFILAKADVDGKEEQIYLSKSDYNIERN